MAIEKTEAIILRTRPFRSSSLIIDFMTRDFGKIQGIAKGVHRAGERRGADFELFTHVEILFYEKKKTDLHLISETFILDSHDALRNQFETITYAGYFCEILNEFLEVHDSHPELFELLKVSLSYLPLMSPEKIAVLFHFKLLNELGFIPSLQECYACQSQQPLREGYFSIRDGGLLCEGCRMEDQSSIYLDQETVSFFGYCLSRDLAEGLKHPISPRILSSTFDLLTSFTLYRLGKPLKSQKLLNLI